MASEKKIKISIITPCLNSESTIRQTIESILNQTYKNIEYIVVDGGSVDGTLDILHEYIPQFEGRLKCISEKDKGIYDAMNKGIRLSTGKMIGIIGSDDYYELDTVEKVVNHATNEAYQVIYGYCRIIRNNHVKYIEKQKHENLAKAMIPHATCFVTRKIYRDFGMLLTVFKVSSDYELMLRLHRSKRVKFVQIQEILANFRMGGASDSKRMLIEKTILQRYYKLISFRHMVKTIVSVYFK